MEKSKLIEQFNKEMAKEKRWFKYSDGTISSGFIQLVNQYGGHFGAIQHCLRNLSTNTTTSGFKKLYDLDELDESFEFYVGYLSYNTSYSELFNEDEKESCRQLLERHGLKKSI